MTDLSTESANSLALRAEQFSPLSYPSTTDGDDWENLETDLGDRISCLLARYDCNPTEQGWRTLALSLAIIHREPEFPKVELGVCTESDIDQHWRRIFETMDNLRDASGKSAEKCATDLARHLDRSKKAELMDLSASLKFAQNEERRLKDLLAEARKSVAQLRRDLEKLERRSHNSRSIAVKYSRYRNEAPEASEADLPGFLQWVMRGVNMWAAIDEAARRLSYRASTED